MRITFPPKQQCSCYTGLLYHLQYISGINTVDLYSKPVVKMVKAAVPF